MAKASKKPKANSLAEFPNLRGKTVLVRVDLNSPIAPKSKKIESNPRFEAHAETVKFLASKGAKVVLLAHQGRKGDSDCLPLDQHARILAKIVGKKILFKHDQHVFSPKSLDAVEKLKACEVLLLDNVRFLDEEAVSRTPEEHARSEFVQALAPLGQLFVQDAWSNAHRAHASMTGFCVLMPSAMGPVFARELEAAMKAREHAERPMVYLLGGAKPEDVLKLMEYSLRKGLVDKVLTSGVIGELCLMARGNKLPEPIMKDFRQKGYIQYLLPLRDLIHQYHEFIETPFDFAYADDEGNRKEVMLTQLPHCEKPVYDIGTKTARKYAKACTNSRTVFIKGPCGKYEEETFRNGTKTVFEAVANSKAYTLIGGGHTLSAFDKLGIPKNKISFISIAGGALVEFLQGNELPAVKALELSAKKFGARL